MINIEQHVWGSTPEGEAIILYTIKNRFGSEVHLTNLGAAVVAVKFADRNGKIEDVFTQFFFLFVFFSFSKIFSFILIVGWKSATGRLSGTPKRRFICIVFKRKRA